MVRGGKKRLLKISVFGETSRFVFLDDPNVWWGRREVSLNMISSVFIECLLCANDPWIYYNKQYGISASWIERLGQGPTHIPSTEQVGQCPKGDV